jgi:hypothetical protein
MSSPKRHGFALLAGLAFATPTAALACSSCGCTLSSDWSSQGLAPSGEGFRLDLRYDYFDQNQLRSGISSLLVPNITTVPTDTFE